MNIYVDYDTTLINLIDPWVKWINDKYKVNITTQDINRWYFLGEVFGKEADNFWKEENHYIDKEVLLPYDGAIDFFKTLQKKYGRKNVKIISSTRDHHTKDKVAHMAEYFGVDPNSVNIAKDNNTSDQNDYEIILTSKEKYSYTKGGVLIDDYPLHVLEHIHFNQEPGIVFNYNNRFGWCKESNYGLDDGIPEIHQKDFRTVNDFYKAIDVNLYRKSFSYDEAVKGIEEYI